MLWLAFLALFIYTGGERRKIVVYNSTSSFFMDKSSHQEVFLGIYLLSEFLEKEDAEKVHSSMASLSQNTYLAI